MKRILHNKIMNKISVLIYFISVVLFSEIESLSSINNFTVSSDVLSELFFKEIRSYNDLAHDVARNIKPYDSKRCLSSLISIVGDFPSLKVAPFIDSWGKLPSGVLYGSLYSVGNFDQCVKTSVVLDQQTGDITGQYCFANIPLKVQQPKNFQVNILMEELLVESRASLLDKLEISVGICIPDSCSPEMVESIFNKAIDTDFNGKMPDISVSDCTTLKRPPLRPINIIGITIFAIFGVLMLLSTVYDFLMRCNDMKPVPLLLAFSVLTNGKKLFAINTTKSLNSIDCLTGIRVFSMAWVLYCHTFLMISLVPLINGIDGVSWVKTFWSMHVLMGTISVDSFFLISGVLVAWLGFRELDRTNGKLDIVMMYVHRYIRLTPLVAAGILFTFSVNKIIFSGPFRQRSINVIKCNGYNWWPVLLYFQNYYIQDSRCFSQTWYLAIDFQLYVLSPLLLIPMWKWGKKFAPVLLALALMSIVCVITLYILNGFTDLQPGNKGEWEKTYTPLHTRCSPWLVGFALGYFMHINRQRTFRLSKSLQFLAWVASFTTLFAIVFAPYFTISNSENSQGTVFEAAMYEGWKRFSWSVALAWITFACHFGFGGIVNSLLSHPFWQPMGRLTYSFYLVHLFVIYIHYGIMQTEYYFSYYHQVLFFCGAFGTTLIVSILVTLAFESPVLVLEKFIFGRKKTEGKKIST